MAPIGTVWFTGPCIILASMQIKRMSIKMNHILICFIKSFLDLSESYGNCSWIQLNCSMLHHCLDEINANTLLDTYKCKDLLFSKFPVVLMLSNLFYTAIKTTGVHTASVELVANHRAYKLAILLLAFLTNAKKTPQHNYRQPHFILASSHAVNCTRRYN